MKNKDLKEKELFLVEKTYHILGRKKIAEILQCSPSEVYQMAKKLNLLGKKLSDTDKEFIRLNYYKISIKEISDKLGVSEASVKKYASISGISTTRENFTEEEEQYLIHNYKTIGRKSCAEHLNRSVISVAIKARELNLSKISKGEWSLSEVKTLKENSHLPTKELMKLINRSYNAITLKRLELGIIKKKRKPVK